MNSQRGALLFFSILGTLTFAGPVSWEPNRAGLQGVFSRSGQITLERSIVGFDSLVAFRNSQNLEARGTLIHITRNLLVFEVYNPYSVVQLSEVLRDLRIMRGERTIYEGRAVVSNLVATGLMLIVSATLVDPWKDLVGLSPGHGVLEEVQAFVQDYEANHRLRPSYQLAISNLRAFLGELSRWLSQVEVATGADGPDFPEDLQEEFQKELQQPVAPKLDELYHVFEEEAKQVPPEEVVVHKAFARKEIHPLILCSPFLHRVFTKPLGYAGDYEMVNMMLDNPIRGQNTYGKLLNSYHLQSGPVRAHRNRVSILKEYLRSETARLANKPGPVRILNVGCGPAIEVAQFLRASPLSDHCEFHLLDFNAETLVYTRNKLEEAKRKGTRTTGLNYLHKSIHELLKDAARRDSSSLGPFDIVYCAGLFDYLSDRVCSRLVDLFYDWTLPGGSLLVTNVHTANPIRQFMEHFTEWYLIYRNEADFLAMASELRGKTRAYTDATGINVFMEIRKVDP